VDRVRTLVSSDRRLDVRLIVEEVNMNRETMQQIMTEDLGMRKNSAIIVLLTDNQKRQLPG
jgi:hypothetical protein